MKNIDKACNSIKINGGFNNSNSQFYQNYSTLMEERQQYDSKDRIIQQFITPDSKTLLGDVNQSKLENHSFSEISISQDRRYYLTYKNFILVVTLPSSIKSINLSGKFLWKNGSQLILPTQFTTQIVNSMNNFTHSNPYFIKNNQNIMQLSYKSKAYNLQSFFRHLQNRMKIVVKQFQRLLYKYGIIGQGHCGLHLDKLRSSRLSLQYKQKVTCILQKNYEWKKQNQKNKLKTEQKQINLKQPQETSIKKLQSNIEEQQEETITVYQYYDQIQSQSSNLQNKICSNSSKFNVIASKFQLIKQAQNQVNQEENSTKQSKFIVKQKFLVQKIIKQDLNTKTYNKALQKLERQVNVLKSIKYGKQYFLNYYLPRGNFKKKLQITQKISSKEKQSLIMDYCQAPLSFYLDNNLFNLDSALSTFLDIITSIQMLHKSGIVHRDLKPQNIMMNSHKEFHENLVNSKVKIIDFSDSALMSQKVSSYLSNNLGHSIPYSPFECSFDCSFGINNPEIDIWSLGIILHELIYKKIPHIFYRTTKLQQFIAGIKNNELSIKINRRWTRKSFVSILEQLLHAAITGCLSLRQCDRIRLKYLKQIVIQVKSMNLQMIKLLKGQYFNQY